jgi:hypothetical protein
MMMINHTKARCKTIIKSWGNIKYDDDRTNAMQDSYKIMGNIKYDDDHTNSNAR